MKPRIVVHKFGGAALADAQAITNVGTLLALEPVNQRRLVVTSALQGVTNQLIAAIRIATADNGVTAEGVVGQVRERHLNVARGVLGPSSTFASKQLESSLNSACDELDEQLRSLGTANAPVGQLSDTILAFGERAAARIVCVMLAERGIPAVVVDGVNLIHTDGRYGNAAPDLARTDAAARTVVAPWFEREVVVVVPGFIGAGHEGHVVTLGRGGSDLTAAVLARALDAREVILWKDVPGCMTADPRIVPDARVVPMLDAREASELAYYGANILHPRTLLPLRPGMTLRLRPFADPSASGTTIVVGKLSRGAPVRAISGMSHQALVAVSGTGMLGVPGVAAPSP
jgi:aspartokinase/homoserine dehydrogenase 1